MYSGRLSVGHFFRSNCPRSRWELFFEVSLPHLYIYYSRFGDVCQLNPVADLGKFFSLSSPHLLYILYQELRLLSTFAARGSCKGAALYTAQIRIKLESCGFFNFCKGCNIVGKYTNFLEKMYKFWEKLYKFGENLAKSCTKSYKKWKTWQKWGVVTKALYIGS